MAKKERLDKLLVEKGLVESREKAQRLIMAGGVFVNGQKVDKAGTKVPVDADIHLKEKERYVSRGGYKLEKGIEHFDFDPENKVCIDIGSSTGGFTDCLLQNGARKVYAVDVGTHQLHEKLRNDPRVVVMEKTNARYLSEKDFPEKIECFVSDVSFISVLKILPEICSIFEDFAEGIILIKPQFELSRKEIKDGVVKDPELHVKAILNVIKGLEESCYCVKGVTYSPVKGPKGNIEFLCYLFKKPEGFRCEDKIDEDYIVKIVMEAHRTLRKE
ncbi:TlyA family RNA methyltransferase [Persephonella sp.]